MDTLNSKAKETPFGRRFRNTISKIVHSRLDDPDFNTTSFKRWLVDRPAKGFAPSELIGEADEIPPVPKVVPVIKVCYLGRFLFIIITSDSFFVLSSLSAKAARVRLRPAARLLRLRRKGKSARQLQSW